MNIHDLAKERLFFFLLLADEHVLVERLHDVNLFIEVLHSAELFHSLVPVFLEGVLLEKHYSGAVVVQNDNAKGLSVLIGENLLIKEAVRKDEEAGGG